MDIKFKVYMLSLFIVTRQDLRTHICMKKLDGHRAVKLPVKNYLQLFTQIKCRNM